MRLIKGVRIIARKKEANLTEINRKRIVEEAKKLFWKRGIENTKISEVAKAAGMCKSTLYVYFKSKEDIKNYISFEAMQYFYNELKDKIALQSMNLHDRYMTMCYILVDFKDKYPLSFQLIVKEICVDDTSLSEDSILREIYEMGEKINSLIYNYLKEDIEVDVKLKEDKELFNTVFLQWGSIYGLLVLADNKESYIKKTIGISKSEFLRIGFEKLFKIL